MCAGLHLPCQPSQRQHASKHGWSKGDTKCPSHNFLPTHYSLLIFSRRQSHLHETRDTKNRTTESSCQEDGERRRLHADMSLRALSPRQKPRGWRLTARHDGLRQTDLAAKFQQKTFMVFVRLPFFFFFFPFFFKRRSAEII